MKKIIIALVIGIFLFSQKYSYAWDGVVVGNISNYDVTDGPNYGFRIGLGGIIFCNGVNWGYLVDSDSNYKTYVAALISAKALKQTVTVFVNQDSSGYCHIEYISVSN